MKLVPLKSLCTFKHGGTPSKAIASYWQGDIPWVSPKDMKLSRIIDTTDHISELAVQNSATSIVQPSSVLVVVRSGILAHSFPIAQIGKPLAFNQDIKAVIPFSEAASGDYIYWFLRSCEDQVVTRGVKKGATVHSVQSGFIENLMVPLRSETEQRKIVDLLSRAEGIVQLRRDAQKKAAELIPAIFLEMFGDPTTNQKGWPVHPLADIATFMSGGTPSKAREDFWSGPIPWVSPKDMKVDYIADAIDHVSSSVLTETNIKLVPIGSILIVVRGMILVHTVPIAITSAPVTINQDMKALTTSNSIMPSFLLWALKIQHEKLLAIVDTAGHGTKKLDTSKLQSLKIPVPPLPLQHQFIERADSMASIITQQTLALSVAENAFHSILVKIFMT